MSNPVDIFTKITIDKYEKKNKRDIWKDSKWKHIANLENDDVGGVGEETINSFCKNANISANINGVKTKNNKSGDGYINNKSVEIKTARLGSSGKSFQHELGEHPWNAEYMLFFDITPDKLYITVFPNFTEEFYKKSGSDSKVKCYPIFPSKSITWRKKSGAFKLDTSININEHNKYTFIIDDKTDFVNFGKFINGIIPP